MKYTLFDEKTGKKYIVTFKISNTVPTTSVNKSKKGENEKQQHSESKWSDYEEDNHKSNKIIHIETLGHLRFFYYVPSNSAACIMRFYEKDNCKNTPKSAPPMVKYDGNECKMFKKNSFLVHTTGNVICPGKKDIDQNDYNFIRYLGIMKYVKQNYFRYDPKTLKIDPGYPRFLPLTRFIQSKSEISNIVATCEFPRELFKLKEIKRKYGQYAKYYPSKFPGLDLKSKKFEMFIFNITYLFYSTGRVLILAATNKYQIQLAFKRLVRIIWKTSKSAVDHEQDLNWKYSYFKFNNKSNGDAHIAKKTNTVVVTTPPITAPPITAPTATAQTATAQTAQTTKKRKRSPSNNNCEKEKKKKKKVKKIEELTPQDRIDSYYYPEVYYVKKNGIRHSTNVNNKRTLSANDFICRAHKMYISSSSTSTSSN